MYWRSQGRDGRPRSHDSNPRRRPAQAWIASSAAARSYSRRVQSAAMIARNSRTSAGVKSRGPHAVGAAAAVSRRFTGSPQRARAARIARSDADDGRHSLRPSGPSPPGVLRFVGSHGVLLGESRAGGEKRADSWARIPARSMPYVWGWAGGEWWSPSPRRVVLLHWPPRAHDFAAAGAGGVRELVVEVGLGVRGRRGGLPADCDGVAVEGACRDGRGVVCASRVGCDTVRREMGVPKWCTDNETAPLPCRDGRVRKRLRLGLSSLSG